MSHRLKNRPPRFDNRIEGMLCRKPLLRSLRRFEPEDFFDLLWQGVWEATFDLAPFGVQVRNLPTERYDVRRAARDPGSNCWRTGWTALQ